MSNLIGNSCEYGKVATKINCYRCKAPLKGQPKRWEPIGMYAMDTQEFECSQCGWLWFGEAWMTAEDNHDTWWLLEGWKSGKPPCQCHQKRYEELCEEETPR